MSISQTTICNKALHFIGIGEEIASITERSPEAEACRLFYDDVLDEILREWPWPFARRQIVPACVNDVDDDGETLLQYNDEFFYAYRYPPDAVYIRKIVTGVVPDNEKSIVRYQIGGDDDGQLILANEAEITIEYTTNDVTEAHFKADFAMAVSYRLASYIGPRLAESPQKAAQIVEVGYQRALVKARAIAAAEESEGPPPVSSFERSR